MPSFNGTLELESPHGDADLQQLFDRSVPVFASVDINALIRDVARTPIETASPTPPRFSPVEAVRRLGASTAVPQTRRKTTAFKRLGAVGAVCVIAVLGIVALINSKSAFAWSDIVREMAGARSLHCVLQSLKPDGQQLLSWEMDYDRERGYRERHYDQKGLVRTEIDDGKSHWEIVQGRKIATCDPAISPATQLERLLHPIGSYSSFQPESSRNDVIDGAPCRCLVAADEQLPGRVSVWIDESKRLRRALFDVRVDGSWTTLNRVEVTYDVDIDNAAFKPAIDNDVEVVDRKELFEATFPLAKAVHQEERFGYLFAIHELKRLGDSKYYILVSMRPTNETRKKLELRPGEVAGTLIPATRIKQNGAAVEQETLQLLATARANGIMVSGYLGKQLQPLKRANPQFRLNAHAKLWGEVGAYNDVLFDQPLPEAVTEIEQACRTLYETIAALESVPMDELFVHDPSDHRQFTDVEVRSGQTQKTVRSHRLKPSETTFEKFFKHLQIQHEQNSPNTTIFWEGR